MTKIILSLETKESLDIIPYLGKYIDGVKINHLLWNDLDFDVEEGKELFVFITRTQDRVKNPLAFEDKAYLLDSIYPDVRFVDDPSAINPFMADNWEFSYNDNWSY